MYLKCYTANIFQKMYFKYTIQQKCLYFQNKIHSRHYVQRPKKFEPVSRVMDVKVRSVSFIISCHLLCKKVGVSSFSMSSCLLPAF